MKELIPRQMFEVVIQASIGTQDHRAGSGTRYAQGTAWRKCIRGDITRKRKLLENRRKANGE